MHRLRMGGRLLPGGGGGDHGFDVDFVGVKQQTDEGHLIVGLVADVADDDDARMAGEVVDARGSQRRPLCGG